MRIFNFFRKYFLLFFRKGVIEEDKVNYISKERDANMSKKLIIILLIAVLFQSCGYGLVKNTTPTPAVTQTQPQIQPQPQTISPQEYLANPDKGVHFPQIPVIGYIYKNKLEIGENLYVRRADGVYYVFEFTTAGNIRVEPTPTPLIEPVEGEPDSTDTMEE